MIRKIVQRIKLFSSPRKEFYLFLKSLLGEYPENVKLYDTALIHKSASIVDSHGMYINNERLEYLGDAVLGAAIADFLYNRFPGEDEGYLTQMRSKLVNRSFLTSLTYEIGLDQFIESNTTNTIESSHIYGDALEALIGAIYLDKGYRKAKRFITHRLLLGFVDLQKIQEVNTNYKSQLIEWSQKYKRDVEFETNEEGSENSKQPLFTSEVKIEDEIMGKGIGSSKKEAQQNASKKALENIKAQLPFDL